MTEFPSVGTIRVIAKPVLASDAGYFQRSDFCIADRARSSVTRESLCAPGADDSGGRHFQHTLLHIFMAPAGLPLALFLAVLWAAIFINVRPAFSGSFQSCLRPRLYLREVRRALHRPADIVG